MAIEAGGAKPLQQISKQSCIFHYIILHSNFNPHNNSIAFAWVFFLIVTIAMASLIAVAATFSASMKSIGTAVTMAGVGFYLHYRNFVTKEGKRTLALMSQQVTFPLYFFTKICFCNQDWSDKPCPDVTKTLHDTWMLLLWPCFMVGMGRLWAPANINCNSLRLISPFGCHRSTRW